jgi:hypothetical protein
MPARRLELEGQARELFAPLGPTYDRVGAGSRWDRTRAGVPGWPGHEADDVAVGFPGLAGGAQRVADQPGPEPYRIT